MRKGFSILVFIVFSVMLAQRSYAQNGLNNFYSAFGIGDLEEKDFTRNFGTGSAGMARKSANYLNELNPASYSALPMKQFIFDVSLGGKTVTYSGTNINQSAFDLNVKRLAVGTKILDWWGASVGFTPFSTIDYKLLNTKYIAGTNTGFLSAIEGSGGLNKLYFSNGFKLNKNFSVGVSTSFLFGNVTTADSLGSNGSSEAVYTENRRYMYNGNVTGGIQYEGKIGNYTLGIAGTYRMETKFKSSETVTILNTSQDELYKETIAKHNYVLPAQYGAGISISNGELTAVADYKYTDWSNKNENGLDFKYAKTHKIGGGVEYAFMRDSYRGKYEGYVVQLGYNYQESYMQIKNQPIIDRGFTIGASAPSRSNNIRYYVGLEFGTRGTTTNGLIKENYVNMLFNFNLKDIWFLKRKEY